VAEIMSATIRPYDIVGRFGGEEFLIVIPNCDVATANEISERIRVRVIEERFATTLCAQTFHVTCSFGVAMANVAPWDLDSTLAAADRALYAAKHSGRNRVFNAELTPVDFASQSPLMS
jgi:diguanylate cyclase (GGDEF)-like protein